MYLTRNGFMDWASGVSLVSENRGWETSKALIYKRRGRGTHPGDSSQGVCAAGACVQSQVSVAQAREGQWAAKLSFL